jgi:formate-dependent nitrite reductase membrane component NrfD
VRSLLLLVAVVFCLAFGAATAVVAAQTSFDIFTLISFLIIVLIMFAVLGALLNPPND